MVFNSLLGRAIIGKEIAKQQGIQDESEQLRLGLVGGLVGSPVLGFAATTAVARQAVAAAPPAGPGISPGTGTSPGGTGAQGAIVPNLIGKTLEAAEKDVKTVGLTLKTFNAYSGQVAAGTIVSQKPDSGTPLALNALIEVTISAGPRESTSGGMPLVQGMSLDEAEALIVEQSNGKIAATDILIVYGYAKDGEPGTVIMQDPDPGTPIDDQTQPTLVVIESITVPDLTGKTLMQATFELAAHKLLPGLVGDVPEGTFVVAKQEPAAKAAVAVFTVVQLTLEREVRPQ